MSILQVTTVSFKVELPQAIHSLLTDTLMMALYSSDAVLGYATTEYTPVGEIVGTGYTAGGVVLTGVTVLASDTGSYISFNNPSWTGPITARGALIYNLTKANRSISVLDFGAEKTSAPFVVQLPPNTPTTALIRLP